MTTTDDTTSKKMTADEIEEQAGKNYDALNDLNESLSQVSAMLTITCDDSFSMWNAEIRENYLWGCSAMIEQAKELAGIIDLRTER